MPTASVTLAGHPATALQLGIPGVGLWYANVDLAEEVQLAGPVTLQVLNTTWQGAIIAGAAVDGRARYRIVAGRGHWGLDLAARAYANDAGLTDAKLIGDAANEAGELVANIPNNTRGPHFNRPQLPASFVLNLLAPQAWYARPDGVVTFGVRPALPASTLPIIDRNPQTRSVTLLAVDSLAGLAPGVATEFGPTADLEISLEPEAVGVVARLYAAANTPSRRVQALARMLAALDPNARFRGVFEYRVVNQTGERLNLQPVRSRDTLPDLGRVPVRAGVPGVKALHKPGSQVLVAFLDADPSRPVVVGFDSPEAPGWMPTTLFVGEGATLGAARLTDPVIAGPFAGTITGPTSLRILVGS